MSDKHERTEKPTPKKKADAREKGQVARSADVGGAVVLLAALTALLAFGGAMASGLQDALRTSFTQIADPGIVNREGVGGLMSAAGIDILEAIAPLSVLCLVAGLVGSAAQVGLKPMPKAIKPDPKKLNPISGAKNIFGINAVFETIKATSKVAIVGGIAALALFPKLTDLSSLVGIPPAALGSELVRRIFDICWKAAAAYAVIAAVDLVWQRRKHEKQLMMKPDEVKREQKEQAVSPELRAALRRRAQEAARNRMMAAVPGADVVVTNPTHFAVALSYDGSALAPVVCAKGQDLIAAQIRRIAHEHDVPVVENPPLARSLHASVEVGREIPEGFYGAVAELLAYVYRAAGRRVA